jgi:hypothetical protein
MAKGPGLQHTVWRDDVRNASTPARGRGAKEFGTPEPVKVNDVRDAFPRASGWRHGTNAHPCSTQILLEAANRELEPTGALRLGGLVEVDVHAPEASR